MKKLLLFLLLSSASFAQSTFNGGTIGGNILPDTSGRVLGSSTQQWDAFIKNLTLSGNLTQAGASTVSGNLTATTGQNILKAYSINDVLYVDGIKYANIAAAVSAAGTTNPVTIVIPSTYAGTECPVSQTNLIFYDYRAGARSGTGSSSFICTTNIIQFNTKTPGGTDILMRPEMTRSTIQNGGAAFVLYPITHFKDMVVPPGEVWAGGGIAPEADLDGTLSGTLAGLSGFESSVTVASTGGTMTEADGGVGYVYNSPSSTTAITTANGLLGRGCAGVINGVAPTNCYGIFAMSQAGVSGGTRRYSAGFGGLALFEYDQATGSGGFQCEDTDHSTHPCFAIGSDHTTNLFAINAAGLNFVDSTGAPRASVDSAGFHAGTATITTQITSPLYKTTTNCAAVGTSANPSLVACGAAPSGAFSCATAASTGTCVVSTTAVTANSNIIVQQVVSEGARLSITCNTASVLPSTPLVLSKSAATSFTITLGTVTTNPGCFVYWIID